MCEKVKANLLGRTVFPNYNKHPIGCTKKYYTDYTLFQVIFIYSDFIRTKYLLPFEEKKSDLE